MKTYSLTFIFLLLAGQLFAAKEYKASLFGLKSDGTTNNTGSFQKAIDYINEQGGGTLVFYVGRYLTGSVHLKSNVSIRLEEGAILVGSPSVYDYSGLEGRKALLLADGQQNITISGKGVIEGQGIILMKHVDDQIGKGHLKGTASISVPALLTMNNCRNITIEEINLVNACGDVQVYTGCNGITVTGVTIKSLVSKESRGIHLLRSDTVTIRNTYFETSGKEIHVDETSGNVSIVNCVNAMGNKF